MTAAQNPSPPRDPLPISTPIRACTVSRDLMDFAMLIDDMETEFGSDWHNLPRDEALAHLRHPDAPPIRFLAMTVDSTDDNEDCLTDIIGIISVAKARGVPAILITEDVAPTVLHRLLRSGAEDFVPYPPPDHALREAIARLNKGPDAAFPAPLITDLTLPGSGAAALPPPRPSTGRRQDCDGTVLAIQGLAGGVGGTTLAVNLAWELANPRGPIKPGAGDLPQVCVLDFDLQFGAVATYLDLPRRESVFELLSDTTSMDDESFVAALQTHNDRLHILTAPPDLLPLDFINPEDIGRIIDMARTRFDYVIIDQPKAIVNWTETILTRAHICFALLELDLRSAQNAQTLLRMMRAENLPLEKYRFVLNRAPGLTEVTSRSRVKRLADSLGISIEVQLPNGGHPVTVSNDQALPLARTMPRAPLRREIQKLAAAIAQQDAAQLTQQR